MNTTIKSVSVDLTYDCNFRCLHCFNSSGEQKINRQKLGELDYVNIINQLIDLNVQTVSFGGGESMLKLKTILACCDAINKRGHKPFAAIVSNGYLIDEQVASSLKKAKVNSVQISFDGNKSHHEWLRNKIGSYDKAVNAIKCLHQAGIKVAVAFTPTTINLTDISETFEFVKNIGVTVFRCQPLMCLGRANEYLSDYIPTYEDYRRINYILNQKRIENPNMFIEWGDPMRHLVAGSLTEYDVEYITISAYGDILISPYLPIVFGNVFNHSIKEYVNAGLLKIWKNSFLKRVCDQLASFDSMDVGQLGMPKIFTDEIIDLDLLEIDYDARTKQYEKQYFNI